VAELFFLILLVSFVVVAIKRGKPVILDTPVIISRAGKYHITLAPQLNRAQSFIEQIAAQLASLEPPLLSSDSVFFSVRDAKICPTGEPLYLLAVTVRGGVSYFQAILPQPLLHDRDSHYQTVSEFAAAVLLEQPVTEVSDADIPIISKAVLDVAERVNVPVLILSHSI
jgi:hypothetical protein